MMRCPHCQLGELKDEKFGYVCDFCGEYFCIEELVMYDKEENEKPGNKNQDGQADG